jgi:hypothetical protein
MSIRSQREHLGQKQTTLNHKIQYNDHRWTLMSAGAVFRRLRASPLAPSLHTLGKHTNGVYPYGRHHAPIVRSSQDAQWKAEWIREALMENPAAFAEIARAESDLPVAHGPVLRWVARGDLDRSSGRVAGADRGNVGGFPHKSGIPDVLRRA